MSNETDLDWLARNVHVWREGKCEVLVRRPRNVDTLIWSSVLSDTGWITKEQWLARRAELQNKPSWEDVPEWAEWIAQSPNGHWEFFSAKPIAYKWWRHPLDVKSKANDASKTGLILGDWRDTLEKRPADLSEQAVTARLKEATDNVLAAAPELMTDKYKFEPFVGVEDSQEQEMKQDNEWFERGELPPVGKVCLYVVSDRLSAEVEITAHAKFGLCFVEVGKSGENYVSKTAELHRFRPIPTERDVLLSIIVEEMNRYDTDGKLADAILAAGFSLRGK